MQCITSDMNGMKPGLCRRPASVAEVKKSSMSARTSSSGSLSSCVGRPIPRNLKVLLAEDNIINMKVGPPPLANWKQTRQIRPARMSVYSLIAVTASVAPPVC